MLIVIATMLQHPELASGMRFFARLLGGYGWSIIILTIVARLILFPLMYWANRQRTIQQIRIAELKPRIDKLIHTKKGLPKPKRKPYDDKIVHLYVINHVKIFHFLQVSTWVLQLPLLFLMYLAIRYTPQLNQADFYSLPLGKSNLLVFLAVTAIYIGETAFMLLSMPKYQRDSIKYVSFSIPAIVGVITLFSPGGIQLYFLVSGCFDFVLNSITTRKYNDFKKFAIKTLRTK